MYSCVPPGNDVKNKIKTASITRATAQKTHYQNYKIHIKRKEVNT